MTAVGWPILLVTFAAIATACGPEPRKPDVIIEEVKLPDSLAIQFRDSATEISAITLAGLGSVVTVPVTWRPVDTTVLRVEPVGNAARLIPKKSGVTDVQATAQNLTATTKVRVLDTVYSVTVTTPDTIVSTGRWLTYTANVAGPAGASKEVVWKVTNAGVAVLDTIQSRNPANVISIDTGATNVVATSAIDRKKSGSARLRTARPASLLFSTQPPQAPAVVRAN